MDESERDAETRLMGARQQQNDLEAQRMRAAVEGALFGEPAVPIKVDRYVILERLGAGGVGLVYSAYDPELDRRVALKLLRPAGGFGSSSTADAKVRLRREAQAMAQLSHPNVITVFDVGDVGDEVYIAMELVDGEDMASWMRAGRHPWREVRDRYVQAGRGLEAAHAAGMVHRDFKPSNVLAGKDGRIRVLDFGLAKLAGAPASRGAQAGERRPSPSESASASTSTLSLTATGAIMGTPAYMAPEQYAGGDVDARSDQYSFCVALYEALFGVRPFAGKDAEAIRDAKQEGRVRELSADELARAPTWLHAEVTRGLARDPAARHRDMAALLAAIDRDPAATRRRVLVAGVAGLAVVGSVAAAFTVGARQSTECQQVGAEIASHWNDGRRDEVRRAFLASQRPFAQSSLDRTLSALDEFAGDWQRERELSCREQREQSTPDPALEARTTCLDQRLDEFVQLADLFADADAGVVENAARAVKTLPELRSCHDARPIVAMSAEKRLVAAELDVALARSDALRASGRYEEALEVASMVGDRAGRETLPRRQAAADVRIGTLHDDMGQPAEALEPLLDGIARAEVHEDEDTAIQGLLSLVYTRGVSQADYEEGRRWGRIARAKIERIGDETAEARLHNHLGVIANQADDQDACIEHLTRAVAIRERLDGAELELASSLNNRGNCHLSKEEHEIAREYFTRSHGIVVAQLGPDHPDAGPPLGNLGVSYVQEKRWQEAEQILTATLELFEKNFGREHPRVAVTLNSLGTVASNRGDLEGSIALQLEAAEIAAKTMGEHHPVVGFSLINAAESRAKLGRMQEARETFERATEVLVRAYGADDHRVAKVREQARNALGERGKPEK